MARPNKILSSPHFDLIIGWLKDGKGDTEIINLLKKQEPPEKISRTTLYNFRKNDFDVNKKTLEEYNRRVAEATLEETVKERVNGLETIDKIIALADEVVKDLINDVRSLRPIHEVLSGDDIVKLKIKVAELAIKAFNAKTAALKNEDPQPLNINLNLDKELDDDLKYMDESKNESKKIRDDKGTNKLEKD